LPLEVDATSPSLHAARIVCSPTRGRLAPVPDPTRQARIACRRFSSLAIVTAFLTVWVNLAVGMLGSEQNPANLMFGGVLAIALIGAVVARFRPQGMARAMQATAAAQGAMALYALFGGYAEVTLHIGMFVIPWLLSAQLFKKGAREQAAADKMN
jgi:hypothetical protein